MSGKKKICVVSSGRADYGLLYWPMRAIQSAFDMELQTVVTGTHLLAEYGMTIDRFAEDGFPVSKRLDMLLAGDSACAVSKSMGLAVIGFADCFAELQPDWIVLLGDRFEMLAAAQAALIARIPLAHLFGGDTTEGAFDESIRHSISKMAHLHCVSNEISARRVIQLGENPQQVIVVGSTGLDAIRQAQFMNRDSFFAAIAFVPRDKNLLITFHPVTLGEERSKDAFEALLDALDRLGDSFGLIFTRPNADPAGRLLNGMLDTFVGSHTNAKAYDALGNHYLSALNHVDAVVGNSSSGLYEAPSFGVATVNIGERQRGRLKAASVIDCATNSDAIMHAIQRAVDEDFSETENPYGDGNASERIVAAMRAIPDPKKLLQKHFFMLEYT